MEKVSLIGIDLAKNVFQLHGAAGDGSVLIRRRLRRGKVLAFLASVLAIGVASARRTGAGSWPRRTGPVPMSRRWRGAMASSAACSVAGGRRPRQRRSLLTSRSSGRPASTARRCNDLAASRRESAPGVWLHGRAQGAGWAS